MEKGLLFIFLRYFLLFLEVFSVESILFQKENKRGLFILRALGGFLILGGLSLLMGYLTFLIYDFFSYDRQIVVITSLVFNTLILACQWPYLMFAYRIEAKRAMTLMIFSFVFRQIVFSLYVAIFTSIDTNLLFFKYESFSWQTFLIYLAFYGFFYSGIALLHHFCSRYLSYYMEKPLIIVLLLATFANLVVCAIGEAYSTDGNDFMYCILLFSNIISLLLIVSIELLMRKIYDLRNENQISAQLLQEKENQFKFAKANMERLNIIAHDLKHESAILRQGGEEAKKLLDEIDKGVEGYDSILLTENQTLNIILNEKWLYCQKHGIRLSTIVDPTAFNKLTTIELYSLFGNLLDNSVEAVMKIKDKSKRTISLSVSHSHGVSSIDIRNYSLEKIKIKDGLPLTTKKDSYNHGFGTKSIENIVNKYDGDYSCYLENDVFVVKIVIPD